jgi:hypothetical protein
MMKNLLYLLPVLFAFSGCVITNTSGFYSGYKKLSDKEKAKVIFTPPAENICARVNDNNIYAITGSQLLNCLKDNDTSVVYRWSPHCHSDMCITIETAQRYCDKMKYKLYIVADYYDMEIIERQHTIPGPLYIANHQYYKADFCGKYNKRFTADLLKGATLNKEERFGRFQFFKGDKVLFARNRLF